jgi:hypothetical protein
LAASLGAVSSVEAWLVAASLVEVSSEAASLVVAWLVAVSSVAVSSEAALSGWP